MLSAQTANAVNTNDSTSKGFASLQIVTASCHGVLNTLFTPPSKKPDWFDALNKSLDGAKVLAHDWVDNIAPKMTASIPNHIIDYGTTYKAVTDEIVQLLTDHPNARGKDDPIVKQVFELIQALRDAIAPIIEDIKTTEIKLSDWGQKMQAAHDELFNGAAKIQDAQVELQAHIEKMNNAIQGLRDSIHAENMAIAGGVAALAIGLTVGILALSLAILATGGAAAVVVGVAGLGLAAGGGVTWGVMQHKVDQQFAEIADDQKQMAEDKRQLIALQGLSLAAGSAVTSIATATRALSDVRTMWALFEGELEGTLKKLKEANVDLPAVLNKVKVKAAQNEWDKAMEFAQQLVGTPVKVEVKEGSLPKAA